MFAAQPRCRPLAIVLLMWSLTQSSALADSEENPAYHDLLQRVTAGDMTIDFRAFRMACLKAPDCEPRGTRQDLSKMYLASQSGVLSEITDIAERMVRNGFVNIEAHATLAGVYQALNEPNKAKLHQDITTALMRSIFLSGDGKTKNTAFEVITDREIYVMMNALGLPYSGTSNFVTFFEEGRHKYEKRQVVDPKTMKPVTDPATGKETVVFFNIDAFSPTKSREAN